MVLLHQVREQQQAEQLPLIHQSLPMGTKVVINGHTYTVEDVGGGVRGRSY